MNCIEQSIDFIIRYCPRVSKYSGTPEVNAFLEQVMKDIEAVNDAVIFPNGLNKQVAVSLHKILIRGFASSELAIAAHHLATHFESYFTTLAGKTESSGIVSSYNELLETSTAPVTGYLKQLDTALYPEPVTMYDGTTVVSNIGERIDWVLKRVTQGSWTDGSYDGMFLGLLTALVFYASIEA